MDWDFFRASKFEKHKKIDLTPIIFYCYTIKKRGGLVVMINVKICISTGTVSKATSRNYL